MIRLLLLSCLLLAGVQSASAQTASTGLRGPAPSQLFAFGARPAPVATRDTVAKTIPPTQWKSGMLIGGGPRCADAGICGQRAVQRW